MTDSKLYLKLRQLLPFMVLILFADVIYAQSADAVRGYWLTKDAESQIEIYKNHQGVYEGKIIWLEEPYEEDGSVKKDTENPDESKKYRKILGLNILKGLQYDRDEQEWNDGKIYDPESGNTYKCYMWLENGNRDILYVKGYIGISVIGRKTKWTREEEMR